MILHSVIMITLPLFSWWEFSVKYIAMAGNLDPAFRMWVANTVKCLAHSKDL